jgi:glyoxylase-like metal-dependent hydrolase (beta-lactamase superfamily II)
MPRSFREIAERVYVLRHPVLDVNTTLVVGDEAAMVVDTLSTAEQGRELVAAANHVTALPLHVATTHHHFDHCFGTSEVIAPGAEIWGHPGCAARLSALDAAALARLATEWPVLAEGLRTAIVRPPDRLVSTMAVRDLGGRELHMVHAGRGHTDNDVAVIVADAGVLIAGDLVEDAATVGFEDSWPLEWPATLAELISEVDTLENLTIVPGHGPVANRDFLLEQHSALAELAWLARQGHLDDRPVEQVAAAAARFPPRTASIAVRRAYADLDGRL